MCQINVLGTVKEKSRQAMNLSIAQKKNVNERIAGQPSWTWSSVTFYF